MSTICCHKSRRILLLAVIVGVGVIFCLNTPAANAQRPSLSGLQQQIDDLQIQINNLQTGAGVPSGTAILSDSPVPPPGYTYTGDSVFETIGCNAALGCWTTRAPLPTPRVWLSVVALNNKIYAIGGIRGNDWLATNEEYDPATNSWAIKSPMPTARIEAGAAAAGGKIYVVGGYDASPTRLATNEEYDPVTDTWTTKAPMPIERVGPTVVSVNQRIYTIGGFEGPTGGFGRTMDEYIPAADSWTPKASRPGNVVQGQSGAEVDGKIYVIQYETTRYDPITDSWEYLAFMPDYQQRAGYNVVGMQGKIYVLGGTFGTAPFPSTDLNEEYDPESDTWTTLAPLPTPRDRMGSASLGNKIFVIGGELNNVLLDSNEEFSFEADEYRYYIHRKD